MVNKKGGGCFAEFSGETTTTSFLARNLDQVSF
jgi:hypothetical protein